MNKRQNHAARILLIDNFDSFTYNIVDYLCRLGAETAVQTRSESLRSRQLSEYDGIVISPGPGNPENMPDLKEILRQVLGKIPVLGICLGHQAIAHFYGAKIVRANPMHGKISLVESMPDAPLLSGIPPVFRVVRYHSLVVEGLPPDLLPLLISREDQSLMAFAHRNLPVTGIQFHPEAHLTEYGLPLLKNWLDVCVKSKGLLSPET